MQQIQHPTPSAVLFSLTITHLIQSSPDVIACLGKVTHSPTLPFFPSPFDPTSHSFAGMQVHMWGPIPTADLTCMCVAVWLLEWSWAGL